MHLLLGNTSNCARHQFLVAIYLALHEYAIVRLQIFQPKLLLIFAPAFEIARLIIDHHGLRRAVHSLHFETVDTHGTDRAKCPWPRFPPLSGLPFRPGPGMLLSGLVRVCRLAGILESAETARGRKHQGQAKHQYPKRVGRERPAEENLSE